MTNMEFRVTREKHLDHMVRVVPFIVTAYAIQCFFIMKLGPVEFAVNGLFFLGVCLMSMITGFVTYDLTHVVEFYQDSIKINMKWLNYEENISYRDIFKVEVSDSGQTFATLKITTKSGEYHSFYFVDDADKIKKWLDQKQAPQMQEAA
jgi:hypothetical protein